MCGGIAGGLPFALDPVPVEVYHHHVLDAHSLIGYAGGLDDDKPALAVDTGDVAPCEGYESVFRQQQVCLKDLLLQFFEHDILPLHFSAFTRAMTLSESLSTRPRSYTVWNTV